jgi:ATP-dependent Clp protease ATP-binding subunit ClpC
MGYNLELSKAAKDYIGDNGYDVQIGICRLKRAMQKYLEDNLANVVLGVEVAKGDTMILDQEPKTKIIIAKIVKPKIVWKNSL